MSDLLLNKNDSLPLIGAARLRNQTDMNGKQSPRNEPQSPSQIVLEMS